MILDQHGQPLTTEATEPDASIRPTASTRAIQPGAAFEAFGRVIQPTEVAKYRAQIGDEAALVEVLRGICQVRATALGGAVA